MEEKETAFTPSKSTKEEKADFARLLFEREVGQNYVNEMTQWLNDPDLLEKSSNLTSVLVFRLGKEWLGLGTVFCKEITHRRQVHVIPHRTGKVLQGLVNINGKLELYVALHELLDIETSIAFHTERLHYQRNRMLVIFKERDLWAFPVDELLGVYQWNILEMAALENSLPQTRAGYTKGMVKSGDRWIRWLDEELLFAGLKRSLQ